MNKDLNFFVNVCKKLKEKYGDRKTTLFFTKTEVKSEYDPQSNIRWIVCNIYYWYNDSWEWYIRIHSDDRKIQWLNEDQLVEYIYNNVNASLY